MTAAIALEKGRPDRSEQLEQLRRQMAAVSGRVGVRSPALEVPESVVAGLPKGVVAVLSGARSLPVSMAAAVSAAGGHVAVVGLPDFGLLAAAEMGADLSRLAVIPNPGIDPVFQFLDVADDPDEPAARLQRHEQFNRLIERFGVERPEAFIDQHRLETDPTTQLLDDLGQSEGERERCLEPFAAR